MRRRIRSATIPLHRHSLPQVAVDGVLVALAYWLAYRLRFDGPTGVPGRYEELFGDTFFPVVIGSVVIFAAFGLYGKWWRYVSQRDYAAIVQAVVVAALALLVYTSIAQPVTRTVNDFETTVTAPSGVLALHLLLMLTFVGGARFIARTVYERPLRGFRPSSLVVPSTRTPSTRSRRLSGSSSTKPTGLRPSTGLCRISRRTSRPPSPAPTMSRPRASELGRKPRSGRS